MKLYKSAKLDALFCITFQNFVIIHFWQTKRTNNVVMVKGSVTFSVDFLLISVATSGISGWREYSFPASAYGAIYLTRCRDSEES